MSCHKCIYAINWGRPFSNKDSTHATCGFTCINFDISGKYQDDFGPIIKSNAVDLMLYEFPTNDCWVDGGSGIPKEGCINFKSIYEDSFKLKTKQLVSLRSFISILENHCKNNICIDLPIVLDGTLDGIYFDRDHTYFYYDFPESSDEYSTIYDFLKLLKDYIIRLSNNELNRMDDVLNTTVVFQNDTTGQNIYVDSEFLQSFLAGKYQGYLTCNNAPNIKMSKEQIDSYLSKECKLFLT